MSGLNINAAFIREELLDGSIGMRLGHLAQARARAATDEQIDEALDLTFGDYDHPIHAALDALVESTHDRLAETLPAGFDVPDGQQPLFGDELLEA